MASHREAAPPRGVWGHAPPENFEILGALRRILEAPETIISPFANSISFIQLKQQEKRSPCFYH